MNLGGGGEGGGGWGGGKIVVVMVGTTAGLRPRSPPVVEGWQSPVPTDHWRRCALLHKRWERGTLGLLPSRGGALVVV